MDYPQNTQNPAPPLFTIAREKPNNQEAEVAVLGSMLLSPEAASTALSTLKFENAFYRPAHQTIFDAILELNAGKSDAAINPIVLADFLERQGRLAEVGGRAYLTQLMDRVPTAANIEHYVEIVRQNAVLRRVIATCTDAITRCYDTDDDVAAVLDGVEQNIFEIAHMSEAKELETIDRLTKQAVKYLESLIKGDSEVLGLRTGFDFDRMITGLKPGELFVLAARPSIGKTALMLNIATNIALGTEPTPIGIFSLEMPSLQLAIRMITSLTRISVSDFRNHRVQAAQWADVMEVANRVHDSKIIVDDTGAIDILELRAKARRMKNQYGVQAIFIDYLQLIKAHTKANASRENEVAMISGSLKAMAKELNIPVVVLAQLNRQAEQGEKPKLANLRESGAIEQDADVVAILHRDRDKQYDQKEDDTKPLPAELIIAKNRNGSCGTVNLHFFPRYTRFENATELGEETMPQ
ncbi:MAG: replicative DNA helicase [Victivallales bacterium]|nr:replicative DNA helicase [Victivallales bacterium]